jgi:hypothetical protein
LDCIERKKKKKEKKKEGKSDSYLKLEPIEINSIIYYISSKVYKSDSSAKYTRRMQNSNPLNFIPSFGKKKKKKI